MWLCDLGDEYSLERISDKLYADWRHYRIDLPPQDEWRNYLFGFERNYKEVYVHFVTVVQTVKSRPKENYYIEKYLQREIIKMCLRKTVLKFYLPQKLSHREQRVFCLSPCLKVWLNINKTFLNKMRNVSDRLCGEQGLSVIENPKPSKHQCYPQYIAERDGEYNKFTTLKKDIDECILRAGSERGFLYEMQKLGYRFDFSIRVRLSFLTALVKTFTLPICHRYHHFVFL